MKITGVVFLSILMVGVVACVSLIAPPSPLPSDTPPPPTASFTPTIIWFPPTATNTPLPTATLSITPTLDIRPKYGNLIFTDDFSDKTQWTLGQLAAGSIATGKKELCLAINQPRGYLFSVRKGIVLSDFYLEITTSPSICRGEDEYGVLLRVSPNLDFYRFGLTCNGKARLDRLLDGQASSPQPSSLSGAVPPGAPSRSRIAVWAVGTEMRFYVNDEYLFTVRDTVLFSGSLGVFARASGEDAMTVNFSDLSVYQASK